MLPSVPRALFVSHWDVTADRLPFADRKTLIAEVKSIRVNHNITPDNAIEATAWVVRRYTNALDFERMLKSLPDEAALFWRAEV